LRPPVSRLTRRRKLYAQPNPPWDEPHELALALYPPPVEPEANKEIFLRVSSE